jgi:hypothetical protein
MSHGIIETPITGREVPDGTGETVQALAQFYRAFNRRDLALMAENWDNLDAAAMDNPLGGIKRGWSEIRTVYQRIFEGLARVQVAFHDYTLHGSGDMSTPWPASAARWKRRAAGSTWRSAPAASSAGSMEPGAR